MNAFIQRIMHSLVYHDLKNESRDICMTKHMAKSHTLRQEVVAYAQTIYFTDSSASCSPTDSPDNTALSNLALFVSST